MKKELVTSIKYKIAISLHRLLDSRKKDKSFSSIEEEGVNSYNEIALAVDVRKATVSDAFNAKSKSGPNSTTVIMIVESLGYTMLDFATIFDSISEADIVEFKKNQ
ncbi:hypothetical protein [Gelidibacter maritimus]|uniref:HTH cro/C1-type domain-containing protein n=1 Tax=Gelidibacter maritimus TaxID=2761487 RepID=A0A7W2M661_9FLAO|nr:hypothetical protein [Gelidibacter maritimus]MBA6153409.1 hypothetical protein [Gelidibacter maritimus]